jgi:cytoskeletal protein CcmA (bactofilin family)
MTSVSDLIVTNNLTTNTLNVSGLSRFENDIYAQAEIIVNSNATIRGSINTASSLNVSGNSILRGNILALSGLNINGVSNFQNNVNITGNINVTGATYLPSLHLGNISDVEAAINNMSLSSTSNLLTSYYNMTETSNLLTSYYNITETTNLVTNYNNNTQISTILGSFYDMTTTSLLFVPRFNISGSTPIPINNSLDINGVLSVGGITNIEQAINTKLNSIALNDYYNKNEINNMNYINMMTATSSFMPIGATTHFEPYEAERMTFSVIDLNINNLFTPNMFVNTYIRISNHNTSTIVLPSAYEVIYGYFQGIAPIGTTFPTYISHNLGSLQSLYVQPNNTNLSFTTTISFDFNMYNTDTTLLIGAPGYSRNKYSHHLVTRIDSMTSITVFKL